MVGAPDTLLGDHPEEEVLDILLEAHLAAVAIPLGDLPVAVDQDTHTGDLPVVVDRDTLSGDLRAETETVFPLAVADPKEEIGLLLKEPITGKITTMRARIESLMPVFATPMASTVMSPPRVLNG